MQIITPAMLEKYLQTDPVGRQLDTVSTVADENLTCQRWLREAPAKRLVYHFLYGDLFDMHHRRVLDVGGGAMTRALARQHRYTLIDLMAHDSTQLVRQFLDTSPAFDAVVADWYELKTGNGYDIVIANDLFPNVDQRLELFLAKYLPLAGEIRLSLTFYPEPRFYQTKRIGADEILTMLAWDGRQTAMALEQFRQHIDDYAAVSLNKLAVNSAYSNGRQICLVTLRGDGTP